MTIRRLVQSDRTQKSIRVVVRRLCDADDVRIRLKCLERDGARCTIHPQQHANQQCCNAVADVLHTRVAQLYLHRIPFLHTATQSARKTPLIQRRRIYARAKHFPHQELSPRKNGGTIHTAQRYREGQDTLYAHGNSIG